MLCIICNYNYKVKEVQGFDEINYWFELNDFTYALQVWLDQGNNVGSDIVNQVKQRKTNTASLPLVTFKTNGLMDPCYGHALWRGSSRFCKDQALVECHYCYTTTKKREPAPFTIQRIKPSQSCCLITMNSQTRMICLH